MLTEKILKNTMSNKYMNIDKNIPDENVQAEMIRTIDLLT